MEGGGEAALAGDAFEFEIGAGHELDGVAEAEGEDGLHGGDFGVFAEEAAEMLGGEAGGAGEVFEVERGGGILGEGFGGELDGAMDGFGDGGGLGLRSADGAGEIDGEQGLGGVFDGRAGWVRRRTNWRRCSRRGGRRISPSGMRAHDGPAAAREAGICRGGR